LKYILAILLIVSLFACRRQIDFNIPEQAQMLVVNSNLCADSFISFTLTYTQSIKDNSAVAMEKNATILIFDVDTNILDIINPSAGGYYKSQVKALPSTIYIAKISIGKKDYWASDSLPAKVEGEISKVDSVIFQGRTDFLRIRYDLSDKQAYPNYYGIRMKHCFEKFQGADTTLEEEWVDVETIDPVLLEDENNKFSKKHLLLTDLRFNNTTINFNFGTSVIINNGSKRSRMLVVYIEQYSFKAYQYYSSLNQHLFYQNDPFSQPTQVKGNISDAFGSFIGRNTRADTIAFKF
jgi:hypothetical protein